MRKIESILCPSCGAKFRAGYRRCPRCRAVMAAPDPAVAAARSRRLQLTAAAIAGAFAVLLLGLWVSQMGGPDTPVAQGQTQPQPAAPAAAPRAPVAVGPGQPTIEAERPFVDPPAAAHAAYAAGDMQSALRHYEEAVGRNPRDPESLSNLGQVLVKLNRAADALPYFERAIAVVPDKWAYRFNRARALGVLGRWTEAVESYRQAQALFPDDYATAFNLGLALRKAGDDAGAVNAFQKAISLDPNEPTFRMALGMTYERLNQPAQAVAAYEEALRLAPEAPDAQVVRRKIDQLRGTLPSPAPAATPGAS